MAFWTNATTEPLRQFRWTIAFGGNSNPDGIAYALKKVTRPKLKIAEITHKYLNHSFYYPGRVEWEPINITIANVPTDTAGSSAGVSYTFLNILNNAGYTIPTKQGMAPHNITLSKEMFRQYLGELTIKNVDVNGVEIESFQLFNPFFTNIEFGELDYSSEEIVDVTATIRYDYAKFVLNGNVVDGTPTNSNDFV